MKSLFSLLLLLGISAPAFATVDGITRVHIVVQNIQDDQDFFLERGPIVGCWGLPQGPQLAAWTAEYKVRSNVGCGTETYYDQINALTCAKVVDSEESLDYMSFARIMLDISACPYKHNARFITMVRTSAAKNFPQKDPRKEVQLTLIK